ncbi:hypothetical protein XELAEV_18027888mg [Xenopus laevis]|uniref:Uncharacterized protein n=1 Tax=Xenopus laevis TaxID=8355 RepID=A0A974CYL4_XENLA|nr:hypothetical protein XELAEV_18027888mg [Xenopus laevis]
MAKHIHTVGTLRTALYPKETDQSELLNEFWTIMYTVVCHFLNKGATVTRQCSLCPMARPVSHNFVSEFQLKYCF